MDERPRMECCGALDLGDEHHGGRPYQCVHDREKKCHAAAS